MVASNVDLPAFEAHSILQVRMEAATTTATLSARRSITT
jgi:hypothetical protein